MGTSLSDYSQTPASNDMVNYFQTGMAPSKVKNAGWDVMADMCQQMGPGSLVTSAGTANAQTITNTRPLGALYTGRIIEFNPGFTNTGAMTLQEDGLTAKNVFANGVAAIAGMVISGVIARCRYDGTNYQLLNPQRSTGSFTITLTGMTSATTGTVNYAIEPSGKMASIWLVNSITGTSNAYTMTGTGIPVVLETATQKSIVLRGEDASALVGTYILCLTGTNSTTWSFDKDMAGSAFTNTGTKGLISTSHVVFTLD